ncbi:MAG: transglycosylase SLT domain-containing protein [bacterium]|nr:transglycosylase SLT domain-containing protein [bacterium]
MSWTLALLLSIVSAGDPRVGLVELQIERNHQEALQVIDLALAEDPEAAQQLGLDYLRGHLLLLMNQREEAFRAFATTMNVTPQLAPYSLYRLALEQERLGHPEVAAGLVAKLLKSNPPKSLVAPAMRLLRRTLSERGDCRLLRDLEARRLRSADRRQLELAHAECARRGGEQARAEELFVRLLEGHRGDEVARIAATRLARFEPRRKAPRTHYLLGLSFYNHREFDRAVEHLARALVELPDASDISRREAFELRYALARSNFWMGRYAQAAMAFRALAGATQDPARRAQVLYQQGRCLELQGSWDQAVASYRLAFQVQPNGSWADSALIAQLRLHWRGGDDSAALDAYQALMATRKFSVASRALLFLASSDLVQDRGDRAAPWLSTAARLGRLPRQELAYWQGRLEEIRDQPADAVEYYLRSIQEDPYHPFAHGARQRLSDPALATAARALGEKLAASSKSDHLYAAWQLLGDGEPRGLEARQRLERRLTSDRGIAPYLQLSSEPAPSWPLWQARLERPEEMLLALGVFDEGAAAILRYFPVARPSLAFTGSFVLSRSGETKRSIYIAEILRKRIPSRIPHELLPVEYRRLLFPFRYSYLILREASQQRVDPYLLTAIIREESRFDPQAFSAASARGLTQFVFPTARRIAAQIDLGPIEPQDLERPEIAIALGAAYLHELWNLFDGSTPEIVAAYNAGEPQAALWRRYCFSDEPEEYLTKVAFKETRGYLTKVLTSRTHYVELYAPREQRKDEGAPAP